MHLQPASCSGHQHTKAPVAISVTGKLSRAGSGGAGGGGGAGQGADRTGDWR